MTNFSWAPVNETASEIFSERTILDGLFLRAIAYGIHLTLFLWTFQLLIQHYARTRQDTFFLVYISLLFILGNVGNATNIKFGEMAFIDDRAYPGGPGAFFFEQSTNLMPVMCNTAYIINSWLQDGLLLYRLWIIAQKSVYIILLPALMFLTSVTLSLFLIIELSRTNITLWSKTGVNLGIPYWSTSIALNVLITLSIAVHLLRQRRRVRRALPDGGGGDYAGITAMLVESAALYTVNGLCFLVSFAARSPVRDLFLPVLGQTQSIAPLLIILRVSQGRAGSDVLTSKRNAGPQKFELQSKTPMQFSIRGTTPTSSVSMEDLEAIEKERVVIHRSTELHVL